MKVKLALLITSMALLAVVLPVQAAYEAPF
jgi:hypothetical protein